MASYSFKNALILAGGYNLSGQSNRVALTTTYEALDATVLTSSGKEWQAGLEDVDAIVAGLWDSATDAGVFGNMKVNDVPITFSPSTNDGEVAYTFSSVALDYSTYGDVGQLMPFELNASGRGSLGRGVVLHPVGTARTASGTGTARLLGAVPAGQRLALALHVVTVSGTSPSLTVTVQRDDNSGMTSPVTAHTFSAATAVGSQFTTVAGAITDTYYRITWTVSGTGPSFNFMVTAGIAS